MRALWGDLQYGLRNLRKTPAFTVTCVLTLALGIGANTAVFSVMNAVLLKSLPVTDPQNVMYLRTSNPPQGTGTVDSHETFSYAVYDALRRQNRGLAQVLAYVPLATGKVAVRYGTEPEEAEGDMVNCNFFSGLGVTLARGRGFSENDEAAVAVISYGYWTTRFSRGPEVLGKVLNVKGVPLTIVGVAAEGFEGLEPVPLPTSGFPSSAIGMVRSGDLAGPRRTECVGKSAGDGKTYFEDPRWWCLRLIGRLSPGLTQSLVQYKMSLSKRAIPIQDEPEGGAGAHAGDCEYGCRRWRIQRWSRCGRF